MRRGDFTTLLIHVGYAKTASSWLQRFGFENPATGFRPLFGSDVAMRQQALEHFVRPGPFMFDVWSSSQQAGPIAIKRARSSGDKCTLRAISGVVLTVPQSPHGVAGLRPKHLQMLRREDAAPSARSSAHTALIAAGPPEATNVGTMALKATDFDGAADVLIRGAPSKVFGNLGERPRRVTVKVLVADEKRGRSGSAGQP